MKYLRNFFLIEILTNGNREENQFLVHYKSYRLIAIVYNIEVFQ